MRCFETTSRRRLLARGAAATVTALFGSLWATRAGAQAGTQAGVPPDLRFRALWRGASIGEHRVTFEIDGDRLTVDTHIDMTVKVLFFTVFRLRHDAREVWRSGRLQSVTSMTERDGTQLQLSGHAVENGFRIVGEDGPFLANGDLLTTNALWDSRIVREARLIDVQYGGEVGLVARPLGDEQVDTPEGPLRASRFQMITPHHAGSLFYDGDGRWVKALVEMKGETIEYVLAP